jgi:hypothetical protein
MTNYAMFKSISDQSNYSSQELRLIGQKLSELVNIIQKRSFWDSPLCAALIGAAAAVSVFIGEKIWNLWLERAERMKGIYRFIAGQSTFWSPRSLFSEASHTQYAGTSFNGITGKTEQRPEKPLGEKMIIELQRRSGYRSFIGLSLKRLFRQYEKSLLRFNNCRALKGEEPDKYMECSKPYFDRIVKLAYRKTGLNEWTVH